MTGPLTDSDHSVVLGVLLEVLVEVLELEDGSIGRTQLADLSLSISSMIFSILAISILILSILVSQLHGGVGRGEKVTSLHGGLGSDGTVSVQLVV